MEPDCKTKMSMLEVLQQKILREIVNAPWYIRNCQIRQDIKVDTIEILLIKIITMQTEIGYNSTQLSEMKRPK